MYARVQKKGAFARFKKLYLRLYLDEGQVHTKIYIDVSKSMSFGKGKKDEQAIKLAATFAYLSVSQMDRVSIYLIRDGHIEALIENMLGKESYLNCIGALNDVVFDGGDARISEAILPTSVQNRLHFFDFVIPRRVGMTGTTRGG